MVGKTITDTAASILTNIMTDTQLSCLQKAEDLQRSCANVGFDWPQVEPVFDKVAEELEEVQEARSNACKGQQDIEEEIGDLFFACINLSRHLNVSPEQALEKASLKFASRFAQIEVLVQEKGLVLNEMSIDELEKLWQHVKK